MASVTEPEKGIAEVRVPRRMKLVQRLPEGREGNSTREPLNEKAAPEGGVPSRNPRGNRLGGGRGQRGRTRGIEGPGRQQLGEPLPRHPLSGALPDGRQGRREDHRRDAEVVAQEAQPLDLPERGLARARGRSPVPFCRMASPPL